MSKEEIIEMRPHKNWRNVSYLSFILAEILLVVVGYQIPADIDNQDRFFITGTLGIMLCIVPYIANQNKIIIDENGITTTLIFESNPVPLEEIERVHFQSLFGLPRIGKKVLNINKTMTNRKKAYDYLQGKVPKITGKV